jgi:proteic killer suppression protein
MIRSFGDVETAKVADRQRSLRLPADIQRRAQAKLDILNVAARLDDLRVPPGNRLETLSGNRKGQHSIRINGQWRVCFVWKDGDAYEVEIVDYHR